MLLLLSFCFGFLLSPAPGNQADVQLDRVGTALGKGDAAGAGAFFDATVELVLPGVEDILTKGEARTKLKQFFEQNEAKGFVRVHGGTSSGEEGAYVIGTLTTVRGTYRVFIYGRGLETPIVQELRIEPE